MIEAAALCWGGLWTGLSFALGLGPRGRAASEAPPGRAAASTPHEELDVGALYQRYAPAIYRRIRRFYDGQEAEEVLQEIFLVVLERIGQFRGEASPSTWLYRVATHHCLNRLRNSARRRALLAESYEELWCEGATSGAQEATAGLRELWRELPEELVMIGVYYHLDGLSHDEIAALVGVSRRTVGNRLAELEAAARRLASDPREA